LQARGPGSDGESGPIFLSRPMVGPSVVAGRVARSDPGKGVRLGLCKVLHDRELECCDVALLSTDQYDV
jgi:hypothetical protein